MAFSIKPATKINSSMMNIKAAALFHSTPTLDRRRRTHWDSGGGAYGGSPKKNYNYSRRCRKMHAKHSVLRNVSEFADYLFQRWQGADNFSHPSSSKGTSWFREQDWAKGKRRTNFGSQGSQWGNSKRRGGFHFCFGDDEDVEVIFRSAFGGERSTYWSFINDGSSEWKSSSYSDNRTNSWKWRTKIEDDYDTYEEYNDDSESDLASNRLALGMSTSGPLKLEDVKSAYRSCALKWHPDRHQGSSKVAAEEKFKLCSAAYQSLCDKLE